MMLKHVLKLFILASLFSAYLNNANAANMDDAKRAISLREYTKAHSIYRELAQKNDIEAQYQLASMYKSGKGVKSNIKSAIYWFDKAARKGHVKAQYNLASCYEEENAIDKARYWYQKAVENNYKPAENKLKNLGTTTLLTGDLSTEEALEKAIKLGFDDVDQLESDADMDNIRNDPRFLKILERLGGGN